MDKSIERQTRLNKSNIINLERYASKWECSVDSLINQILVRWFGLVDAQDSQEDEIDGI